MNKLYGTVFEYMEEHLATELW